MIKTNWHTHTSRCGHAVGTDEEYVKAAVEAGVKVLGFSDHAAYLEPLPSERMNYEQVEDYMESILSLKEKYKDQIEIHLGMEVEYYPDQWEQLSRYRNEMEYCILGQHQLTFNGKSSYELTDREELMQYVQALNDACERSLCDYIAHPDVALWSYPRQDGSLKEAAEMIADISLKYNMPLELNCGSGVREMRQYEDGLRYPYPNRIFFETFAEKGCPIVIGMDIHDPELFLTDKYLNRALSVIEGLDCHILENFDIISAAKQRKKDFH